MLNRIISAILSLIIASVVTITLIFLTPLLFGFVFGTTLVLGYFLILNYIKIRREYNNEKV
jgi:predicted membrane channel-forming protein YqfA (hemolysin III family)